MIPEPSVKCIGWLIVSIGLFLGPIEAALPGDTAAVDTNRLLSDQPLKKPMRAVLRSAIIPGWGQFYNQQYLKAGIAFAVNGYFIYRILDYHQQWRTTHDQGFRDRRNLYTWYLGAVYALTLLDAYVDAYLYGFDQAMEISLLPAINKNRGFWMWSVNIHF